MALSWKALATLALGVMLAAYAGEARALAINVINDSGENAWLTFGNATPIGTYTLSGQPSEPLSGAMSYLAPVNGELTGIDLTSFVAGRLLLSVGSPLCPSNGCNNPDYQMNGGPGWQVRWDKIEMTYDGSVFSVANLSSTDFFGLTLKAETFEGGAPVNTVGWKQTASQLFTGLLQLYTSGGMTSPNPQAVVVCPMGASTCKPGRPLRVIAPSSVPPPALSSFASLQPYLGYVENSGVTTDVAGQYTGRATPPACPIPNACGAQSYNLTAEIPKAGPNAGALVLTGTVGSIPGTHTIIIPAAGLSQGLLGTNPNFTVDGIPDTIGGNDVFSTAVRDILSGFNYGFVASPTIDPNTLAGGPYFNPSFPSGRPYTDVPTNQWYDPPVGPQNAFAAAQPPMSPCSLYAASRMPPSYCYNQYAEYVAAAGDSYGFPFSDLLGKVHLSLDPAKVDTLDITILSDGGVGASSLPEPQGWSLSLVLVAGIATMCACRPPRLKQPA